MKKSKFLVLLLLFISGTASACFVSGLSCENDRKLFSLDLKGHPNSLVPAIATFNVYCDTADTYSINLITRDKNIAVANPSRLTGIQEQEQQIEVTATGDGSTYIDISYSSTKNNSTGSCRIGVNVTDVASNNRLPVSGTGSSYFLENTGVSEIASEVNDKGVFYVPEQSSLEVDPSTGICSNSGDMKIYLTERTVFSMGNFNEKKQKEFNLFRGSVKIFMNSNNCSPVKVNTPIKSFVIGADNKRVNKRSSDNYDTSFEISYQQDGLNGTTTVNVTSGSVSDAEGSLIIEAGQSSGFSDIITKTTRVLPADGDNIIGNAINLFVWTSYNNTSDYLLEYNFPSPSFSQNNSQSIEFEQQTVELPQSILNLYDDLVLFQVYFSEFDEQTKSSQVETRLFIVDKHNNIIANTVSSDYTTLGFE